MPISTTITVESKGIAKHWTWVILKTILGSLGMLPFIFLILQSSITWRGNGSCFHNSGISSGLVTVVVQTTDSWQKLWFWSKGSLLWVARFSSIGSCEELSFGNLFFLLPRIFISSSFSGKFPRTLNKSLRSWASSEEQKFSASLFSANVSEKYSTSTSFRLSLLSKLYVLGSSTNSFSFCSSLELVSSSLSLILSSDVRVSPWDVREHSPSSVTVLSLTNVIEFSFSNVSWMYSSTFLSFASKVLSLWEFKKRLSSKRRTRKTTTLHTIPL